MTMHAQRISCVIAMFLGACGGGTLGIDGDAGVDADQFAADGDGDADVDSDADGDVHADSDADARDEGDADDGGPDADGSDGCDWVQIVDLSEESLNVREEPTTSSAVLGSLDEGQRVHVLEEQTGELITDSFLGRSSDLWFLIERGALVGWVTALYCECTDEPELPPTGSWVWPVTGTEELAPWSITLSFGASWSTYHGHLAEDFGRGENLDQPVFAMAAGVVTEVYSDIGNYRDIIIIEHDLTAPTSAGDSLLFSRYGHCGAEVVAGRAVEAGERIGRLVDPYDFVPHLHFEIVNEIAHHSGPFCNGCEAAGINMGPGYAGYDFDATGIDVYDVEDGIVGNRFYRPSAVIESGGAL